MAIAAMELSARIYVRFIIADFDYLLDDRTWLARLKRRRAIERGAGRLRGSPRAYRINSLGFRGPEPDLSGASHLVACMGNGTTHGDDVEDGATWPAQLGSALRERFGDRFTILNMGVPGAAIEYAQREILPMALALSPAVLIVSFAGLNEALGALASEAEYLAHDSATWRGLRSFASVRVAERICYGVRNHVRGRARVPRVTISDYERCLRSIVSAARARGVVPILVNEETAHADMPGFFARIDFEAYRAVLKQVSADTGVIEVDPRALFAGSQPATVFHEGLVVYSPEGNRRIAEALASLPTWTTLASTPGSPPSLTRRGS